MNKIGFAHPIFRKKLNF